MDFEMMLEKLIGEEIVLNNAVDLEKAINELSKNETGTSIVIEVQPSFDNMIALSVDYVELREKRFLRKSKVIDAYYRIHAVVDISEDKDFINYYLKTKSRLKVSQIFLDFIAERRSPNLKGWTKDNQKFWNYPSLKKTTISFTHDISQARVNAER